MHKTLLIHEIVMNGSHNLKNLSATRLGSYLSICYKNKTKAKQETYQFLSVYSVAVHLSCLTKKGRKTWLHLNWCCDVLLLHLSLNCICESFFNWTSFDSLQDLSEKKRSLCYYNHLMVLFPSYRSFNSPLTTL